MLDAISDTICIDATAGEEIIDLSWAVQQVEQKLPGWCWKVGTCCVSDDAWVAPDMNCPVHGTRLKEQLMPAVVRVLDANKDKGGMVRSIFDAGVDVDRRPPGNVGQALLDAMNIALDELTRLGFYEPIEPSLEKVWRERNEKTFELNNMADRHMFEMMAERARAEAGEARAEAAERTLSALFQPHDRKSAVNEK